MVKLSGDDTATAIKQWAQKELIDAASRIYELGRFLFSVSLGTVGLFVTIENLKDDPQFGVVMLLALMFFLISMFEALGLALPKEWKLDGETNLLESYNNKVKKAKCDLYIWGVFWLSGTVLGLFAITP